MCEDVRDRGTAEPLERLSGKRRIEDDLGQG
jgi:hypothetical protein